MERPSDGALKKLNFTAKTTLGLRFTIRIKVDM